MRRISLPSRSPIARIIIPLATSMSLLVLPTGAVAEESEPKQLQRLYKCLDNKIAKISQKQRRRTAEHVLGKCDNRLQKWLDTLPVEAHDAFIAQLTESLELALEDAANGNFVADEG